MRWDEECRGGVDLYFYFSEMEGTQSTRKRRVAQGSEGPRSPSLGNDFDDFVVHIRGEGKARARGGGGHYSLSLTCSGVPRFEHRRRKSSPVQDEDNIVIMDRWCHHGQMVSVFAS